jgi:hypothetical protein
MFDTFLQDALATAPSIVVLLVILWTKINANHKDARTWRDNHEDRGRERAEQINSKMDRIHEDHRQTREIVNRHETEIQLTKERVNQLQTCRGPQS